MGLLVLGSCRGLVPWCSDLHGLSAGKDGDGEEEPLEVLSPDCLRTT